MKDDSPGDPIQDLITRIRDRNVILDVDLARLYGVSTKQFNQAVRRNLARFPSDFVFQLTDQDLANLRSQIVTSRHEHGGRRYLPYAFTEHGTIMAATVLNSPKAVEMSVFIVRAFVVMRGYFAAHAELASRLDELEETIEKRLEAHDEAIAHVLATIRALMGKPASPGRPIGFVTPEK